MTTAALRSGLRACSRRPRLRHSSATLLRFVLAAGAGAVAEAVPAPGAEHLVPAYHYQQTLVAAEDMEGGKYLVSPITLQLSETELLISYKRGFSHAFDHEADFDLLWLDPVTQRTRRRLSSRTPEIVRFEYDWAEVK